MTLEDAIKQKKFGSEYQKLIVNLIYTGNWINEKELILFKKYGLTGPQYNVLRILKGQYPQPATVNLIIERMLDRMSNASRIVDRLERKELVMRKQCKNDRRAVDVIITERGLEVLDKIDLKIDLWESSYTNLSLQEARQMNSLLDKLRAGNTLKN
ncbi:MAG: MarR family transcriptional regulator [Bacteroidetes bacterium]|nr:MarR family transcriptional regulator [Bacteroidota bacterium]